ncbi:MAG TPA: hypothetical protein VHT75_19460 [Acidimicrobiales bacterium]|jgi:hypothetical protein|nr:hypothetical protein [Acidimicrobiales bacterium]
MANPRNATTTARGRTYKWRDETFTSVTTIIGGGIPKPALVNWAAKRVAEIAVGKHNVWTRMDNPMEQIDWLKRAPYREKEGAALQGSAIHDWAEKRVLGLPVTVEDMPPEQRPYGEAFLQFVGEMHPEWEMAEASVFNREHGYAGTLDALMRVPAMGDGLGLVDYKTGKGVYGEVALQLSAYRSAEFVGLADGAEVPMPPVEWCAVLHITERGYQLIPVDAGPLAFEYFLHAQAVRDFCDDISRGVLLAPVAVPQDPPRDSAPTNVAALVD